MPTLDPKELECAHTLMNMHWHDNRQQFRTFFGPFIDKVDTRTRLFKEFLSCVYLRRMGCSADVPAPRLVGIEPNPGPKNKHPVLGAAAIASAIGTAVAAATKKKPKNKKPQKAPQREQLTLQPRKSKVVSAPRSLSVQSTSIATHTPFIIRGRCLGPRLATVITTANPVMYTSNGSPSSSVCTNAAVLDLLGNSTTLANFAAFPATIRTVALSFTQYRFRKLVMNYVPFVTTGTYGMVMFGVTPEAILNTTGLVSSNTIGAMEVSASTPVWSPLSLDVLKPGGLRSDWLFLDSTAVATAAELRQEAPGSLAFAVLGALSDVTYVYGALFLDYEIELRGIALESDFGVLPPNAPAASSSSSSSSSTSSATTSIPDGWSLIKNEK